MFKIQNGRLYPNVSPMSLSFKIPEEFWMTSDIDSVSRNAIQFKTPDGGATVEIMYGYKEFDDTAEEVLDEIEGCPEELMDGPYPVTINGMEGHCLYNVTLYAVMLDIGKYGLKDNISGNIVDRFEFTVSVKAEEEPEALEAIHAIAASAEIADLLKSITIK